MTTPTLPPLPYDAWEASKATLHLVSQILGKTKLAHHPKQNHWWHVTLHVTPRGLSTHTVPTPSGTFELELDLHRHELVLDTSDGRRRTFSLPDRTIAEIYRGTMDMLADAGHPTSILTTPYDNPHSTVPFEQDDAPRSWDRDAVGRFLKVLQFVDEVFKSFSGRSFAKSTPVHLFWHSFDLALTRFTGREVPDAGAGARRSDAEAYSHEVISFGFWPGDPKVRFPAFYSYTAPEPEGLAEQPLEPTTAWWQDAGGSHMAMLKYDDLRDADDPRGVLLRFLESAFRAGCATAD
ncbi:MAG: DUF5996 family protein, partial [Myxococcota bacterium]